MLSKLFRQLRLEKMFLREALAFWSLTRKYNASNHTDEDIEKMQYTLLRENHVIEKGMSLRHPKKGFGKEKVKHLLQYLDLYVNRYADKDASFLKYPMSTIRGYIAYMKDSGVEISDVESLYMQLLIKTGFSEVEERVGIVPITREYILSECKKDFESLLKSRHSIRYFKDVPPDINLIKEALVMAQLTPSACNRQGWKVHIFSGNKSLELLKWQGGCRGFEEEMKFSILVTADLKAFLSYEVHQAYVDGGLYAMNLINALHSLGIGTIPLSTAFDCYWLARLKKFGIPDNEVPILIIGIGEMEDQFNVASSVRKDPVTITTWH